MWILEDQEVTVGVKETYLEGMEDSSESAHQRLMSCEGCNYCMQVQPIWLPTAQHGGDDIRECPDDIRECLGVPFNSFIVEHP